MKFLCRLMLSVGLILGAIVAFSAPASANHTLPLQPTRTIVYQYMPGKVPVAWQVILNDRLHYLDTIPGHPIDMVQGSCQLYLTCVHIYAEPYGASLGWDGLVSYANSCGQYLCKYSGASGSWTTLQINTSLADNGDLSAAEKSSLGCHELGHTVKLQHSGGQTCMQVSYDGPNAGGVNHFMNSGGTVATNEELELYDMYINGGVPLY